MNTWPDLRCKAIVMLISLALSTGGLPGCATSPPAGQGASRTQPEQIQASDGSTVRVIKPGDATYAPMSKAFDSLIAGIDERARTFFTDEQFAAQVAPRPWVEASYGRDVVLAGKGMELSAARLVVASLS
jgi:hypothetical protein